MDHLVTYCKFQDLTMMNSLHGIVNVWDIFPVCDITIVKRRVVVDSAKFGDNNQIEHNYLIWLFIYMGIGLALSMILPFPISFGVLLLALFLPNLLGTRL